MVKPASSKIHLARSLNRSWMISAYAKSLRLLGVFIFTWKTDPAPCSKFRMKVWQRCRLPKWMYVCRVGRLNVTSGRWALRYLLSPCQFSCPNENERERELLLARLFARQRMALPARLPEPQLVPPF